MSKVSSIHLELQSSCAGYNRSSDESDSHCFVEVDCFFGPFGGLSWQPGYNGGPSAELSGGRNQGRDLLFAGARPQLTTRKLPAVYLLHGCGTSFRDWSNYSDVGAYSAKGLILVMVDGGCSYYMNAALSPGDKYEDYFVHDVIGDAESRLPILRGRESRAVVGVSMGGFAAVKLSLTRPDLFAFSGAISPAIDVPSRGFTLRRWAQSTRFRGIFGPSGSEARLRSDPYILVKSADPSQTPYLYITAGEQESLLPPIRRFVTLLKERKFSYEFHTKPGGHDWDEWDAQIPGCFESVLEHIQRN
jgi:putative tributyrin esterase